MLGDAGRVKLAICGCSMLALAGCGSSAKHPVASAAPSAAIPQIQPLGAQTRASRRFLLEVNTVCRAVRQGAPQPLSLPYQKATVIRYTHAAQSSTQRTIVSLQRLAAQGDGQALRLIANGYVELQAVYSSAGVVARDARSAGRLGQAIQLREQAVTAAARSAGLPACGVAGR